MPAPPVTNDMEEFGVGGHYAPCRRVQLTFIDPFGTPILIVDQMVPGNLFPPGTWYDQASLKLSANLALLFRVNVIVH